MRPYRGRVEGAKETEGKEADQDQSPMGTADFIFTTLRQA